MTSRPNPKPTSSISSLLVEVRVSYRAMLRPADLLLGTAGCVLASRLTEDPSLRVLVLESGGRLVTFLHRIIIHFNCVRSGRSLFLSRLPVGFPRLFHTKHVYELHTEPQISANGKKKYWPRGAATNPPFSIPADNSFTYLRQDAWRM